MMIQNADAASDCSTHLHARIEALKASDFHVIGEVRRTTEVRHDEFVDVLSTAKTNAAECRSHGRSERVRHVKALSDANKGTNRGRVVVIRQSFGKRDAIG